MKPQGPPSFNRHILGPESLGSVFPKFLISQDKNSTRCGFSQGEKKQDVVNPNLCLSELAVQIGRVALHGSPDVAATTFGRFGCWVCFFVLRSVFKTKKFGRTKNENTESQFAEMLGP